MKELIKRNIQIYKQVKVQGKSPFKVALKYKLTPQRIYAIVALVEKKGQA